MRALGPLVAAPVDHLTSEPDQFTDDEAAAALLAVLERVRTALAPHGDPAEEAHVVRCAGCGGWAWDERPCSTCTAAARRRRRQHRAA